MEDVPTFENKDNERGAELQKCRSKIKTLRNEYALKSDLTSRMERIKPEKLPRQRVQKIWRNVRWHENFPDDSLSMDVTDITPHFALRKIALLFETKKFGECASLIRRLNCVTLGSILKEVPIDVLHDSLPQSLNILEALYVKLFETTECPSDFPREELHVDQLLQRLVAMFAAQSSLNNKHDKNSNSVYPSCRNILRVITWTEPGIRRYLRLKKRDLDKCLRHLGRHGLVESSEDGLMNIHDALKIELEKVVAQYKSALQKLDELCLSAKHPMGSSVTFGPAPALSSHQRLMQISRNDVQDRLIKNRTIFNIGQPGVQNQCLKKLIDILEKRIEYDKMVLFHDTELRKMFRHSEEHESIQLSTNLKEFSQGYATVLQLLKEVADEDLITEDEAEEGIVSSDEEVISPLMHADRIRTLSGSLNGTLPNKNFAGNNTNGGPRYLKKGLSFTAGTRPSIIHIGHGFHVGESKHKNGFSNGHAILLKNNLDNGTLPTRLGKLISLGDERQNQELELENVRDQLEKSKEMVKKLQQKEKQYLEQLSLQSTPQQVESARTVELIRQFGRLYHEDREAALQALNDMELLKEVHSLKGKILFSVIVLAFRSVQQTIQELRGKLRHLLNLPNITTTGQSAEDPVAMEMERHIEDYLCKCFDRFDVSSSIEEVCSQIYATLYDYPCLKQCEGLKNYIENCIHTAWGLSVQRPPFTILYDSKVYQPDLHTRVEPSNNQSILIQNILWPALLQTSHGPCVHRALVQT